MDDSHWIVARSEEEAMQIAMKRFSRPASELTLAQDPDVLDTWFSSGLFPFSVMGWPEKTPDMANYYPGSLLETGQDILFFWVARMVMMGLHLTKQLPFKTVYLHAMVRDKFGRKMSKSLGNVLDPLDVIHGVQLETLHEKLRTGNLEAAEVQKAIDGQKRDYPEGIAQCGSDALRFGLLAYSSAKSDINLDIQRVVAYRQFCNKLWNATKFALTNFGDAWERPVAVGELVAAHGSVVDKWILHRLAVTIESTNAAFTRYDFGEATTLVYNFWLYDLCDYYLELIKPVVKGDMGPAKETALAVLFTCLERGLRLIHPLMPFVSEELFHRLPGHEAHYAALRAVNPTSRAACGSIMVQKYPNMAEAGAWVNTDAEADLELLKTVIKAVRSSRASLGLQKKKCDMHIVCSDTILARLAPLGDSIGALSYSPKVYVYGQEEAGNVPAGCTSCAVNADIMVYLPVADLVDLVAEATKTFKQRSKLSSVPIRTTFITFMTTFLIRILLNFYTQKTKNPNQ
jgi:valyl-tRNA synthetase